VVDVLVDAAERRVVNDGPVNLGFGNAASVLEVIEAIPSSRPADSAEPSLTA
jgi:UDP-glucose 4-epimerase